MGAILSYREHTDIIEIRRVWPTIRQGVQAIFDAQPRISERHQPLVEDVYIKLATGEWALFGNEDCSSFSIIERKRNVAENTKLWFVHFNVTTGTCYTKGTTYLDQFVDLARQEGVSYLKSESHRNIDRLPGWERDVQTFRWDL